MTDRELLQQALDALEHLQTDVEWQYKSPTKAMLRKVEKALRARLAQPEREWVGLTDKEILADDVMRYHFALNGGAGPISKKGRAIIAAVETKLKEKNYD